ncbi:hypothetical protein [Streptomyces poriferorum]|uniref:Uncharacterized protein n=1 Tax=Streptomyces poriferorum TaxID=2798799 RepID=A0ABY9J197_9ACTN|nr:MULTISPECIES: hypothetical protein [unclassified Streptomyces]MDP5309387.1 hypothetical protein [Streptomyces sp. Alt4]WLQ61412.1 hypothetical protein P8A19_41090 [Streptomyces sp. Alt2]
MTLTIKAQTIARAWWPDVDTADQKLTSWIRERGGITVTDEADHGKVLRAFPDPT